MLARRRVQRVRRQGAFGLLGAALFGISAEETRPTTSRDSYVAPSHRIGSNMTARKPANVGAPIILECLSTLSTILGNAHKRAWASAALGRQVYTRYRYIYIRWQGILAR